jgi:kynurenine 3-monooxygenase
MRMQRERVLIVGAGLVGCVLAIALARRGFRVTIFERNEDCRERTPSGRPSLSLSLCTRGLRTLDRLGVIDRVRGLLAPAFGRMIHAADGSVSYQPYSAFGDAIQCVSRRALCAALLDAAEEAHVEIRFEHGCVDIDVAAATIAIADRAGAVTHHRARAIFATDGSSSVVRRQLVRAGWCQALQHLSDEGYTEFRISAAMAAAVGLQSDALHGWPREQLIAGAFPNPDGSFSGTLHMARFDRDAEGLAAVGLLHEQCPDLARLVPDAAAQLQGQRPNRLVTVSCRPWSAAGTVLLLGDAAHAMLPYYGQGANAGFEDCELLDDLIARHGPDWARVFDEFERIRQPDIAAMADLCHEHLAVLRDQVSQADFQRQWRLEQCLHRLVADAFTPLYSMIAFSSMSYAEARRRDALQQPVVRELLRQPDIEQLLAEPIAAARVSRQIRSRLALLSPARSA